MEEERQTIEFAKPNPLTDSLATSVGKDDTLPRCEIQEIPEGIFIFLIK